MKWYNSGRFQVMVISWLMFFFTLLNIFTSYESLIPSSSIVLSLICLTGEFYLSFLMVCRLLRPLEQLSDAVQAMADYSADKTEKVALNVRGCNEIIQLAVQLGKVRDALLHQIKESAAQEAELQALYNQATALNAVLEASLQEKQNAYIETIKALADAIEAKDEYTRGHSDRVLSYAMTLGEALGLEASEMETLKQAAILHDIGKIGVSTDILTKRGKLTVEEFDQMKKHPMIGYRILLNVHSLWAPATVISQHHERPDGQGYPLGLPGDKISPLAKILAIADTYDAMTSSRPYRAALTQHEALDEIRRNMGKQFDEYIASKFCELAVFTFKPLVSKKRKYNCCN